MARLPNQNNTVLNPDTGGGGGGGFSLGVGSRSLVSLGDMTSQEQLGSQTREDENTLPLTRSSD